jgi:enoyl-CoA hydratase
LAGTDIRVAAEDATFGVTEVARGLYPMAGSSIRLPRQIPYCLAAEIVLLGRHINAQEALAWGLVNRLVPKGQALTEAKKIAAQLCETGPLSLKAITRSLRELQTDVAEADAMLKSDELAGPVFASADAKEGMRAFKEKRKAVFEGK